MKIKSKKWIERELLKEWRLKVLKRDNYTCQISKKKPNRPQCHHILPRQIKELRYDVMNGIVLDFNHHKVGVRSAHQNALFFADFLRKNKPKQYKYLMRKMKQLEKCNSQ